MGNAAIDCILLLMAQVLCWPLAVCGNKGGLKWVCCCTQLLKEDVFFSGFLAEDKFKSGYIRGNRKKFL